MAGSLLDQSTKFIRGTGVRQLRLAEETDRRAVIGGLRMARMEDFRLHQGSTGVLLLYGVNR